MSILRFPDENAVFVVDFISIKRLPFRNLAGYDLEVWLSEMRTVEALGADIVIPGHGQVGTTDDVVDHRHYVEELRDAVAEGNCCRAVSGRASGKHHAGGVQRLGVVRRVAGGEHRGYVQHADG